MSKYSLTSWPEVIVVFHGEYKRTVTHTLTFLEEPLIFLVLFKGSLRGKSAAHTSFELTSITTGALVSSVPAEGSHSWNVSPDKSSATRCNHNSTTRHCPRRSTWCPWLLPLVLDDLQLDLSLYSGHPTRNSPELADPKVSRPHVTLLLSWPHFAILYSPPHVRFDPFHLPHNNIWYPFLAIPNPSWWWDWTGLLSKRSASYVYNLSPRDLGHSTGIQVLALAHVSMPGTNSGMVFWHSVSTHLETEKKIMTWCPCIQNHQSVLTVRWLWVWSSSLCFSVSREVLFTCNS
jgi:hypothetical protein